MKLLAAFLGFVFLTSAHTASAGSCTNKFEIINETQVQILKGQHACYLTVHPRYSFQTMIYRDFLFDDDGLFLIFNSYGNGDIDKTTAAREYRFFPRITTELTYSHDAATNRLSVTHPSGKVFVFDSQKAVLISISGADVQQDYSVNPQNKGGIEISVNEGLMLDGGFAMGESPSQNPKSKIAFKDRQGQKCQVFNGDFYRYDSDGDVFFKYDDAQLKSVLKQRCPLLNF